jgi:hypothetical protein
MHFRVLFLTTATLLRIALTAGAILRLLLSLPAAGLLNR